VVAVRFVVLLVASAVVAAVTAAAARSCDGGSYVYAGLAGSARVSGVGAEITPEPDGFDVRAGHVAGWVGVGGPGEGPNGSDEWLQVGFSAFPDWTGNDLYYEVARPGAAPRYARIRAGLASGEAVRVSVLEIHGRRDWWRVWVDGSPASEPIHLPRSDGRWRPIVTAESWDGGMPTCNDFRYRFEAIRVADQPGGLWRPLESPVPIGARGTLLARRSPGVFEASGGMLARETLSATPAPAAPTG
jgi:hypothetical protein